MRTNYILIDYENVQPKDLAILNGHPFKVYVFVGANQTKVPFALASAMQELGQNAEYVRIDGNGTNALDFHIAFYVGQIAARDPGAYFHIVSKDTGFDPLIRYLKAKNIYARRSADLSDIPFLKLTNGKTIDEKVDLVVERLQGLGPARPRKTETLAGTIDSLFMKRLDEADIQRLIERLRQRKIVTIANESVAYRLPGGKP